MGERGQRYLGWMEPSRTGEGDDGGGDGGRGGSRDGNIQSRQQRKRSRSGAGEGEVVKGGVNRWMGMDMCGWAVFGGSQQGNHVINDWKGQPSAGKRDQRSVQARGRN